VTFASNPRRVRDRLQGQPFVMREHRTTSRAGGTRRATGALLALLTGICSATAVTAIAHAAAVTGRDVSAAEAQLTTLNLQLDLLVERYDQEQVGLQTTQDRLAAEQVAASVARGEADAARASLAARAAAAYEGGIGSNIDVLLGATSLDDLNKRLQFVNAVAQSDTDAANRAQSSEVRAREAGARLSRTAATMQSELSSLQNQKDEILAAIGQQQTLVHSLKDQLARQQAAAAAAAAARAAAAKAAAAAAAKPPAPAPSPTPTGGGGGGPPPPPPSGGASAAVSAAASVLGVPYQWGGSDPSTGFDCSGLTMWAWAHGGVSLPHSSAMQYAAVPHVDRSQLQPGDLVFFYSPISHVGIYVGGDMMIDAPHTGGFVEEISVNWESFVGAGRP
jgi:peptidoglycan DL-endopeptidase CwlO